MGTYVVKPDPNPDVDEYVLWSTVVEAPLAVGDAAYIAGVLAEWHPNGGPAQERIDRARRTGSSAFWPPTSPTYLGFGETAVYDQRGIVKTADMAELCRRLADNPDADVSDLLEPFET